MRFFIFSCFITLFLGLDACVKPRIYKAEVALRNATETREKVLVKELIDRKSESAALIKQVGDLNRTIGSQENELSNLRNEMSSRTQTLGASSNKLANEKADLEKELSDKTAALKKQEELLTRIKDVQNKRKIAVSEIDAGLASAYAPYAESGITVTIAHETVMLTLPDKVLFEPNGLSISASGKNLLTPMAEFLATRPGLDIDVVAYTDNALPPKEKTLKDTWDWSLQRATVLTRLLIREFNTNANQITPIGRGEFYPVTSNETAEGRQKNRRTVIVVRPNLPAIPLAE